jgi:rare lipoprotein A
MGTQSRGTGARLACWATIGAACLAVAGCASSDKLSSRIDPKYGVASSARLVDFGDPVPKGGGTYRIGKPYTVAGRMYVPEEDIHYRAEGMASWYGDDFHGRQTANGEIFDMTALTAAHPTLPMPCYVRVTNIRNGKSLILRVNDRGPYHGNRLIDVSTRAAKMLEFDGYGVARVRVEYVGRAPLEGSDDRLLEATLRTGVPAPAPSAVMVASAKPFVPEVASPVGRIRGQVPIPEGRPYSLGNTSADVASLNATSEMSASRRASVDERVLFNPREVSYDSPVDDSTGQPVARMSRPVSAYAPTSLGASPDPMAGRGLY